MVVGGGAVGVGGVVTATPTASAPPSPGSCGEVNPPLQQQQSPSHVSLHPPSLGGGSRSPSLNSNHRTSSSASTTSSSSYLQPNSPEEEQQQQVVGGSNNDGSIDTDEYPSLPPPPPPSQPMDTSTSGGGLSSTEILSGSTISLASAEMLPLPPLPQSTSMSHAKDDSVDDGSTIAALEAVVRMKGIVIGGSSSSIDTPTSVAASVAATTTTASTVPVGHTGTSQWPVLPEDGRTPVWQTYQTPLNKPREVSPFVSLVSVAYY